MPNLRDLRAVCINVQAMTHPRDLTDRQRDVLRVVEQSIARRGYPPTRAEIADALGFKSANAAQEHLQALARKGFLSIEGSHRGIQLAKKRSKREAVSLHDAAAARARSLPADDTRLPLIGRVAAGQPILAEEHVEARYAIDPALFHPKPDYLLRVVGLSMRDAGLLDGDLVAVHATTEVHNGQVVVARIGDEATVKTFERRVDRGGRHPRIRLLPANPDFAPIEVDPAEPLAIPFVIEGIVVGVLRRDVGSRPAPK